MKQLLWLTLAIIAGLITSQTGRGNGVTTNVDIGISGTGCASYEVNLKPYEDFQGEITQIRFTLKWPENTLQLQNFASSYGIQQQGAVLTQDGYNYAYFLAEPYNGMQVNWAGGNEYTVLTFEHDESGEGYMDILIAQDDFTIQNNNQYHLESNGEDNTGNIYHQANNTYAGTCNQNKNTDIGLFNTSCGTYEVRLKPSLDIQSAYTNLQFTIKWPENSVGLIDFESEYGIEKQGPAINYNGFNYVVFAAVPSQWYQIDWEGNQEYVVLSFSHDGSGTENIDIEIASDEWAVQNNGLYYFEVMGEEYSRGIYQKSINSYTGGCNSIPLRVFLQGPYDTDNQMMSTLLNDNGVLLYYQPYGELPWNYAGEEYVASIPDSVVDWVLVELRDSQNPASLVQRKACLLSKNGVVMDMDFSEEITFSVDPGNYYLVIDHRNHLPVMSGNPVAIPATEVYDFTEVRTTQPYLHENPLPAVIELDNTGEGVFGMIAGDVNNDGVLQYTGSGNDRDPIISLIYNVSGSSLLNKTISGYFNEDVTMDNIIKYTGSGNDRDLIINNLYLLKNSPLLNVIYAGVVPDISNQ